mgnify:CR=1 FL=1
MLLKKTNIEEKLNSTRVDYLKENNILEEVRQVLADDSQKRERISNTIQTGRTAPKNHFNFELLQTQNIYHLDQIRQICIDYRLRFLDSKYFKGDIPPEAISKIKSLEREHNIEVNGFKIIAPSKLFKLKDKDDPLLFAPIGNDYYYLIHKWGDDLHPLRKILMWPFKNIGNLLGLIIVASWIFTLLIPEGLFSKSNTNAQFIILFFFMFKSIVAVAIFYGFALGKNFNPAIWNSKYFNA